MFVHAVWPIAGSVTVIHNTSQSNHIRKELLAMNATRAAQIRALVTAGATAADITKARRDNPNATKAAWVDAVTPTGPALTCALDRLVVDSEPGWPTRLTNLAHHDTPWWLWVDGNQTALNPAGPTVAIVGARVPSKPTVRTAATLAADLAAAGVTIITTLGGGVGRAVAAAALDVGGVVIAITGAGIDCDYPQQGIGLKDRIIAQGGCLVSEVAPDTPIGYVGQFLERNRVIAGLADLIVVAEAKARSGALNLAGWAGEFERPVMVTPFDMNSRKAAGSFTLLKDGAPIADSAQAALDELT